LLFTLKCNRRKLTHQFVNRRSGSMHLGPLSQTGKSGDTDKHTFRSAKIASSSTSSASLLGTGQQ